MAEATKKPAAAKTAASKATKKPAAAKTAASKATKKPAAAKTAATVAMVRNGKTADVHPAEVEHMKQHGWTASNGADD